MPQTEDQRIEEPQQGSHDARPQAEQQCGEAIEGERQECALQQRHEARRERHAVHGARPHLCLHEAGAVGALVVDVPMAVGGDDRADRQDR
jgi:hypothetical protein